MMLDGIASDAPAMARYPGAISFVAGYVDGLYRWSTADWALFPNSVHVRIAVFATTNDGHVLDCEPGNCTPAESVDWVLMRRRAGVDPTVYCNELDPVVGWPAVRAAFRARGVAEPHYWVANYSVSQSNPVVPVGAVALQYRDAGAYDLSVVADYWPGVDSLPVGPVPTIPKETAMQLHTITGSPEIWALAEGRYWHVADIASLDAYRGLPDTRQVTITAAEHAAILASGPSLILTDAQVAALTAAVAAGMPKTITLTGTETVTETGTLQ